MTIEQLKAHMDRRFDRLAEVDRTKALQLYCFFLSARDFPPLAEVAERQTR